MSAKSEHRADRPRLIVGIGASAGGLDAARRLLERMPTDSGMALIIVMHLDPTHESHIAELLRLATPMEVMQAADEQPIRPNSVYVIAPDRSLEIRGGVLLSTGPRAPHGSRKLVDTFFTSLALDQGERSVGVILSGTGNDGSSGLRDIEARGGLCLVQDPETAEFDGMPENAISTGVSAYVLPPEEMPRILVQYLEDPEALSPPRSARRADPPEAFHLILDLLSRTHGLDFRSSYKKATLERRAERRMGLRQLADWHAYLEVLQEDPLEVAALYRDLLIGVTEFFRDREVWEHLQTQFVPRLLAQRKEDGAPLKIWVPGCATGEEAYSLAIMFLEQMERLGHSSIKLQIFASDVAEDALSTARRGLYPPAIQEAVSPERLARFFRPAGENFEVTRDVRDSVTFTAHNLLADPPFFRLDLVSCRNLLIYLEPHAQQRAFQTFHFALKPGGLLLLGASETVGRPAHLFQAVAQKVRIYRSTAISEADRHHRLNWLAQRPSVRAESGTPAAPPSGPRVSRLIEQIVLSRYTWACVVVSESFEIQSFFGPTDEYLMQPTGEVRMDLLAWARPGLYYGLRTALDWVVAHRTRLNVRDLRVDRDGISRRVECTIEPITPLRGAAPLYLVGFRDSLPSPAASVAGAAGSDEPLVRQLEAELKSSREELRGSVEQLESSNEEYRASHEELLSLNEELQSSNEELEASKEELQSLNEEMVTINRQLEDRNAQLRLANTDLNNLLTSTHIPIIFLDRDLRVRRFTPAATELMRLVSSDLGQSVEHIRERFFDGGLITDARRVLDALIPITAEVQTEEGRWFTRTALPYRTEDDRIDGVCIAFHDITDRKKAAQEMHEARIFAEAIVATVRTALLVLDKDLHVASANEAFYEMFRVARSETEGFFVYELGDHQWDIPNLRLLMEKIFQDEVVTGFEVEHEFERIGRRVMRLDGRLMRRIDRQPLILLAIEDCTERKAAARLADERRDELIHEQRRKDEFLAMLGHELRNPLSALMHGLELLNLASGDSPAKEIHGMMIRQASRIGSMLDQLLDIARLTAGKLRMARVPVALKEVVQGAVEAVTPLIESRGQTLTVSMPGTGDVMVLGDLMRLTQVVENLLSNAAKYSDEGGKIELVLSGSDGDVEVRVRDDGIGMAAEFVPHVFDLFVQEPRTLERSSGGLGLGLALVKLAVEMHGGSVVASSPGTGQGSEFVVTLPRLLEPRPAVRPEGVGSGAPLPSRPRRILVVDDEKDAAGALAELLAKHGHESRVAHSGTAALEAAVTFRPEVVLLDLGLPRMDGYEVAKRLREEHPNEKITLVALTGYQKDDERIQQAGFDRHMIKPPDMRMLFSWLAAWDTEAVK